MRLVWVRVVNFVGRHHGRRTGALGNCDSLCMKRAVLPLFFRHIDRPYQGTVVEFVVPAVATNAVHKQRLFMSILRSQLPEGTS